MKHLKRFNTFVNESFHSEESNPFVDQILAIQSSIDPAKCEFHSFTKEELVRMDESALTEIMADLQAAKASCEPETVSEEEESIVSDHMNDEDEEGDDTIMGTSFRSRTVSDDDNFKYEEDKDNEGDEKRHVISFDDFADNDEEAYKNDIDFENEFSNDEDDDLGSDDVIDEWEEEIEEDEELDFHSDDNNEEEGRHNTDLPSEMW